MFKAGALGTLGAIIAVAVTFFVADAVSGPLMATPPGAEAPEAVALGAAIGGTVVGAIVGLVLAIICNRFLKKPGPVFLGVCAVGLVAYGALSFSATEEVATGLWLNIMHIAAAVPIVGLLVQAMNRPASA